MACGTRDVKTHAECACVAPPAQLAPCGLCGGTSLRPKAIPRDAHGARPVALELLAPARCRPAPSGAADPAAAPAPGTAPSLLGPTPPRLRPSPQNLSSACSKRSLLHLKHRLRLPPKYSDSSWKYLQPSLYRPTSKNLQLLPKGQGFLQTSSQ